MPTPSIYRFCPECGADSVRITDSRPSGRGNIIRRRRCRCQKCRHTFSTVEMLEVEATQSERTMELRVREFLDILEREARRRFSVSDDGTWEHGGSR